VIAYPGDQTSSTNTVALISLALIDYLSLDKKGIIKLSSQYKQRLNKYLNGYLNHLKSIHLDNKHFSRYYYYKNKTYVQEYDPYADGETLLALIKAAKYLGHAELIPIIEQSAIVMAKHYTYDQWINNYDSPKTKGFFQWSCMAFWEYQDAGWKDSEFYRQYVLSLAWWMINIHKTLYRKANTAYVYEGIIPALLIARDMKRKDVVSDLEYTIDRALYKLTSWQVGGPLQAENFFMLNTPIKNKNAIGGIMNYKNRPVLRIDVTQHQMHVVIWALRHVYR
jgi:UDP-N-acetylmuramoyl-tripeptide--D-alanyl-D-alanine ligase